MERLNTLAVEAFHELGVLVILYLPLLGFGLLVFLIILGILWTIRHRKNLLGPLISWYLRSPKFLTRWEVLMQKRRQRRAEIDQMMTDFYSDLLDEIELVGMLSRRERKQEAKRLARGRNLPELLPQLTEELNQRKTKGVIKKRMMIDEQRNKPVALPDAKRPRDRTLRTVITANTKPK